VANPFRETIPVAFMAKYASRDGMVVYHLLWDASAMSVVYRLAGKVSPSSGANSNCSFCRPGAI
jgi:hypothetical protein